MRSRARGGFLLAGLGAIASLVLYAFVAAPASAHFGAFQGSDLRAGFAHPFSGIDHVAAMTALGLWAALVGGRALWLMPSAFAAAMALGAGLAEAGLPLPGAEDGIALSVAVLGVLLAVAARPRLATGAALAAAFGLVHGYAHGAAMPASAQPLPYALGFLSATLLLLLAGIALGLAGKSRLGRRLLPIGAAAVAGIGVTLMLAL